MARRAGGGRRDRVIYYQYKAGRARRTLRGIDEQIARAEIQAGDHVITPPTRYPMTSTTPSERSAALNQVTYQDGTVADLVGSRGCFGSSASSC
jgi:hypothetical protein